MRRKVVFGNFRYRECDNLALYLEKMAREGRRFYTVIDARPGQETYTEEEYQFGKRLLDRRDPLLRDWLDWQERRAACLSTFRAASSSVLLWPVRW